MADVWWQMFGMAAAVYVVVGGMILWAILRKRGDTGSAGRDNAFISIGGVAIPTFILIVLAVITIDATRDLAAAKDRPLRVEVVGHKWWWEITYADSGIVTANELQVPVGRPVEVTLRSDDVIHSFWVPELGGKTDLVPGETTSSRFTVDSPGEYTGACAEYCGIQHANMRFLVVARAPEDFDRWVARHRRPAVEPTSELEARGQAAFVRSACAGCHTIRGTDASGDVGPDLTLFGTRRTLGALLVPNDREHLAEWVLDAPSLKPGVLMPPIELSDADLEAIVAYLESLG